MSYSDLLSYANELDNKQRLTAYRNFYTTLQISGLHYFYFESRSNTLALCTPEHRTHRLGTAFLLCGKANGLAINTLRWQAQSLKRLLDFQSFWELDLLSGDLLVVLQAFADYLRLIPQTSRVQDVLEWARLTSIPLRQETHVPSSPIHFPSGRMQLERHLHVAVRYLSFLKRRTTRYYTLPLEQLPMRRKRVWGIISGTAGPKTVDVVDLQAIAGEGRAQSSAKRIQNLPSDAIFSLDQVEQFFEAITSDQDKMLFAVLRCLGLRESEAAGIKLAPQTIPRSLFRMDYLQAKEWLRNNLKGDLQYLQIHNEGRWVCYVRDRNNPDYRASYKRSGERREIPWIFSRDDFEELLINALREREGLLRNQPTDHGFLFVSRDHRFRGVPITGQSVYKKYHHIVKRVRESSNRTLLQRYSPHTFRHFYATYLLKVLKISIDDVSRWLGHGSTETTATYYAHWMPTNNKENGQFTVARMKEVIGLSLVGVPRE